MSCTVSTKTITATDLFRGRGRPLPRGRLRAAAARRTTSPSAEELREVSLPNGARERREVCALGVTDALPVPRATQERVVDLVVLGVGVRKSALETFRLKHERMLQYLIRISHVLNNV